MAVLEDFYRTANAEGDTFYDLQKYINDNNFLKLYSGEEIVLTIYDGRLYSERTSQLIYSKCNPKTAICKDLDRLNILNLGHNQISSFLSFYSKNSKF